MTEGFLLVDKPVGISSFQVVRRVRQVSSCKRVGHAGTLDPFATGLLVLALGRSYTRQLSHIQTLKKTYVAEMIAGVETDTLDCYGRPCRIDHTIHQRSFVNFRDVLSDASQRFHGKILQTPPSFSAKKVNGRRAYALARRGEPVELAATEITIDSLVIESIRINIFPVITFSVTCSKGTYVRQLAADLAATVGTIAYLKNLRRSGIGPYHVHDAIPYADLSIDHITSKLFTDISSLSGSERS